MDMDSRHNVYMKRMQTEQVKVGAFADKERAYVVRQNALLKLLQAVAQDFTRAFDEEFRADAATHLRAVRLPNLPPRRHELSRPFRPDVHQLSAQSGRCQLQPIPGHAQQLHGRLLQQYRVRHSSKQLRRWEHDSHVRRWGGDRDTGTG